jgi:uncharacterized protein YbcI
VTGHFKVFGHVGFLFLRNNAVSNPHSSLAEQIAHATWTFERQRTGHGAEWVTVVLCEHMLFITLRNALSPAEQALSRSQNGAAQVQLFHRELFAGSAESFAREIQQITGTNVNESAVLVFENGTMILVLLLTEIVATETWSGPGSTDQTATGDK